MAITCDTGLEANYGVAAHGVRWAISQIPGNNIDPSGYAVGKRKLFFTTLSSKEGVDGYEIKYTKTDISVIAATLTGLIGGLLDVARQVTEGAEKNVQQELQFKTRLYKHEIGFEGHASRDITKYTPEFIETLFRELARRHFNAVVLYAGYHPFEFFLDYEGKPHYCDSDPAMRKRNFDALTLIYETAKKYGIKTFLHHYVSHFTQKLSNHLKLGLKEDGTRLANFDHPEVDEYCRYVYRRTFETLPCLDGLLLNFESCGNSVNLLKKTLFTVTAEMKKKPMLVFRLWGLSDVEGMAKLIKAYPGPKALKHKGHESNDLYYYPVCDDRIKVWKKALPDVEFFFSNGPCHNCGTNISQKLWTDPEYTRQLLKNFQDKGADSMTFQSIYEQLLPCLPGTEIFPEVNHAMTKINHGHLEAVVDYVRGKVATPQEWATRVAKRFKTSEKAASAIFKATVASSQIILKQYQQFCYGSAQEGYLYPGRFSHYQEPFFYYPMSFLNRIGEIPNVSWRPWAVRDTKIKVLPDDTQAPIDYVNPAVKKKAARHPLVIAKQIEGHIKEAQKALALYKKEAGKNADAFFVEKVVLNCLNGERIRREILIAVELCSCYFAKSKAAFFKHLKNARAQMLESAKVLGEKIKATDAYCLTTSSGPYRPAHDAAEIEKILQYEKENIPFEALQCYLRSHERYNEIRRLFRPYAGMTDAMKERNLSLLEEALNAALEAVAFLEDQKYALYRDNVTAWVNYLWAEIEWLTPPTMACPNEKSIAPNEGFRSMVHDQCYRWGEYCWEDFSSFYRRQNFFRDEVCDCRAVATDKGLKLTLREHGIDWKEREAAWDKNRGTVNQTGFMQIVLDPRSTGTELLNYTIYFKGKGGTRRVGDGKPSMIKDCDVTFEHTDSNWRFEIVIPWSQLGKKPAMGEIWRLNIFSNPPVKRNHRVTWSQGYECKGDVARLGTVVFV